MSKSKNATPATTTATPVAAATVVPVADQLGAIEKSLATIRVLTKKERKTIESRSQACPDALINKMIQIAEQNGGLVAGMAFDAAAAKTALTQVSTAQAAATASRTIAQKLEDGASQQRILLADRVFGIYTALGRLVNTPEGNPLLGTHTEMKSLVKNRPRKPRAKKPTATTSAKPATANAAAPAATQAAAPATAPAPAPTPAPAVEVPVPAPVAAPVTNGASHS